METGNSEVIKIIWLCHFSNTEVQKKLPIWKEIDEFASWIPNLAKGFENQKEYELHIISPHQYLKKQKSFNLRGIKYHFIPFGIPIYGRRWPRFINFDLFSNYFIFNLKFRKIVARIKPDIVNLIGAENAYYSSAILGIKDKYPIIIGIQGFISQFKDLKKKSIEIKKRINIEEKILKRFNNFFGEQDSSTYINGYNDKHNFYKIYFPVNEEYTIGSKEFEKEYDCIYFGRLVIVKGAEEFIKVISELKKDIPEIKACIVGGGNQEYFKDCARRLNCINNIDFIGFVKTQDELFKLVKKSKVYLTPPFKERLSSTIREAMYLNVPIVAYATGGIPYINEFDENIYMVETGDYKTMAAKTLRLLTNETERNILASKAYNYAINEYSLDVNIKKLTYSYTDVIKNSKL
jgi:glycosyltransferase involved in cell wall biosynthesis